MPEPEVPSEPTDVPPDVPSDAASKIEHDLINSLASIIGFSQLIRRDPSLPEDLRRNADLLVDEAVRTRRAVQVLLDHLRQRPPAQRPPARPPSEPIATEQPPPGVPPRIETTPDDPPPGRTAGIRRPRVLVVEDEITFRIFLEKALDLLGYEPVVATLGREAVALARGGGLAAILCDHQMPGMSGIEVYDAVVVARPELARAFVMMSGDVLDPAIEAFSASRPITLLAKPFDLDALDRTLRAVIDPAGQSRG